jgi:hypothetical protein
VAEDKLNESRERCIKERGHDGVEHRDKYNGTWRDADSGEPLCRAEHYVDNDTLGCQLASSHNLPHEDVHGNKWGTKKEAVDHPDHYNVGGIEVVDIADAYDLGRYEFNVVKYVLRAKFKGKELEDLKKARFYLCRLISLMEKPNA